MERSPSKYWQLFLKPIELRFFVWKILVGYLPLSKSVQAETLERRRKEYKDLVEMHYTKIKGMEEQSEYDIQNYKQILADVPRTMPENPLFTLPLVQELLTRILCVWNARHPASGYVQGLNDLCVPFLITYLSEYITAPYEEINAFKEQLLILTPNVIQAVEADVYWSLCNVIEKTQDVYTTHQPGAHKMMNKIKEIVKRVEPDLAEHMEQQEIEYIQFAFRWVNCFLMREFPIAKMIRMWDTYFSEDEGFAVFHVYVCASFLLHWKKQIQEKEFPPLLIFLQSLPTDTWTNDDVEVLLAKAYQLKVIFHNTKHIK